MSCVWRGRKWGKAEGMIIRHKPWKYKSFNSTEKVLNSIWSLNSLKSSEKLSKAPGNTYKTSADSMLTFAALPSPEWTNERWIKYYRGKEKRQSYFILAPRFSDMIVTERKSRFMSEISKMRFWTAMPLVSAKDSLKLRWLVFPLDSSLLLPPLFSFPSVSAKKAIPEIYHSRE